MPPRERGIALGFRLDFGLKQPSLSLSAMASLLLPCIFPNNASISSSEFPISKQRAFLPIPSSFTLQWRHVHRTSKPPCFKIRCYISREHFSKMSSMGDTNIPSSEPTVTSATAKATESSKKKGVSEQYVSSTSSNFCILHHGMIGLQRATSLILILVQILSPFPWFISSAGAVLYSPDTKVPRTGELALRKAIPANANMKMIQESLEDISYLLRIPQRKPYGTMEGDVKKAIKIAFDEKESILGSIPADLREKGSMLYASLVDGKGGLQNLIESIKEKDPDKVSLCLSSSLDTVAELELLQAPGLSFFLPEQFLKYPRLTGRGIVEFTIEKGDGTAFSTAGGGGPQKHAAIQVVLDGYSAPLTAGNFAKLVINGAYDGVRLKCSDQAILSGNEIENNGYGVPLEIMPSGQFEPLYKTTLSVQDGELPVLPLSVYGAVAMAHSAISEDYSAPSQFFIYLYDKRNAGLGGLSFEEGQFSVFGYITAGREILPQIKTGDRILSAKMLQGQDRLALPDSAI